jgi:acetylornithine deacetylase/succinyl-diaminopimelate desuccinylase-like protein
MDLNIENVIDYISDSVKLKTIAGNLADNIQQIKKISNHLEAIGFSVQILGESRHHQPCLIAKRRGTYADSIGVTIYNHYDVEPVIETKWSIDPFKAIIKNDRLYGRGVADNKSVLWARIYVLEQMIKSKIPIPEILWLIQGEEEIGPEVASPFFKSAIIDSGIKHFLEETGYINEGRFQLLLNPFTQEAKKIADTFFSSTFSMCISENSNCTVYCSQITETQTQFEFQWC